MKQSMAIVGDGLAGLTAVTYLAHAGHDVTVFEQSTDYGGRATEL
jgi:phytoene dehydrogenase-like protein